MPHILQTLTCLNLITLLWGLRWWLSGKESACQCRRCRFHTWVRKTPLEEGMATHSSILAWIIPWTEEPGGLRFIRSQSIGHNWRDLAHMHVEDRRMTVCSSKVFFLSDLTSKPLPHPVGTTSKVLGWPKSSLGFSYNILQGNPSKLFGQPSIAKAPQPFFTTSM